MPFSTGSPMSQMMLLAGMILLAWVLVRRNLKLRKKARRMDRDIVAVTEQKDTTKMGAPLADAPKEVLRWQTAMFELQRDLKAELDARILVAQTLVRQTDQRIAQLQQLSLEGSPSRAGLPVSEVQINQIRKLHSSGHSCEEISEMLGIARAEIELSLGSDAPQFDSIQVK